MDAFADSSLAQCEREDTSVDSRGGKVLFWWGWVMMMMMMMIMMMMMMMVIIIRIVMVVAAAVRIVVVMVVGVVVGSELLLLYLVLDDKVQAGLDMDGLKGRESKSCASRLHTYRNSGDRVKHVDRGRWQGGVCVCVKRKGVR